MDFSLVKFFDEDEDETMHSGEDIEAFAAALNRDIIGDNASKFPPSSSADVGNALSQGTNHQLFPQWQSSNHQEDAKAKAQEQQSSAMEVSRHEVGPEVQHPPNDLTLLGGPKDYLSVQQTDQQNVHMSQAMSIRNADNNPAQVIAQGSKNESPLQRMQKRANLQTVTAGQAANAMHQPSSTQVNFSRLLSVIKPRLDKDRAMQLQRLYARLRKNKINKEEFVRCMKTLVGDDMLKKSVYIPKKGQDETIHSGSNVKAFAAVLNKDVEGGNITSQPPFNTDFGRALSQGANHIPRKLFQQWHSSIHEEEAKTQAHKKQSSVMEIDQHECGSNSRQPENDTSRDISQPSRTEDYMYPQQADHHTLHLSQAMNKPNAAKNPAQNVAVNSKNETQLPRMQRMANQPATGKAASAMNQPVPFAKMLSFIIPLLDKDRAMQLQGLYAQLRNNNISKEHFVRHMKTIVGDHMLKMAVFKVNQGQFSAKRTTQKPSAYVPSSSIHQSSDSSSLPMDNNDQKSRLLEHQSDSDGVKARHLSTSNVGTVKQQQQQKQQQHPMHLTQSSLSSYGNTSGDRHLGPSASMNMPSQSFKQQTHDLHTRSGPVHPSKATQAMNQCVGSDMKRLHEGGLTHSTSGSALQQVSGHWQPSMNKDQNPVAYAKPDSVDQMNGQFHKPQVSIPQGPSSSSSGHLEHGSRALGSSKDGTSDMMSSRPGLSAPTYKPEATSITEQLDCQNLSSGNSSSVSGIDARTPLQKPYVGHKKPLEAPVNSISKKQKVSEAFSDQSIEQLNDVTAVSGVNLREEEEQLFSGSKEENQVSRASRKAVQEEEERLILQIIPLQNKLAEIMAKCGIKKRSNDVERCLSLCVEGRMRRLISNLVRRSRQRVNIEKQKRRTVITSDIRQQIISMNQKAREESEKKQCDAEQLQRPDESEVCGDGDDGGGKSSKVNRDEDDKMPTTATNVAARAAVGGDDILSKWQLMAEQVRQKREVEAVSALTFQPIIDVGLKPMSTSEGNSKDNLDTDTTSGAVNATTGPIRKYLRNQDASKSDSVGRTISVKDVISVLGREIQMSKSALIYRIFEKVCSYL